MRSYDAIIAGGGLIGSAIALELARNDLRVALFDAQDPGREASWASAGILSPAPENPGMISMVPLGMASLAMYPEFIELVEELSGIQTGYRTNGTVEALFSRHAREELNTIVALHRGLGLKAEAISAKEARELEPALSEEVEAAVLRPQEASVDNRLLANALIVAAGAFSSQIAGASEYAPVSPAKGQMVSLRCAAAKIDRVLWSERIYVVPRNDGRILCGATVEHVGFDKTVTASGMHANLDAAMALVPVLATAQVEESWAGLRPDTPDHLPIIGPTELEGLLIATGHFRSGVLLTPITAKLIAEFILEKTPS